jgi:hypothetical protein
VLLSTLIASPLPGGLISVLNPFDPPFWPIVGCIDRWSIKPMPLTIRPPLATTIDIFDRWALNALAITINPPLAVTRHHLNRWALNAVTNTVDMIFSWTILVFDRWTIDAMQLPVVIPILSPIIPKNSRAVIAMQPTSELPACLSNSGILAPLDQATSSGKRRRFIQHNRWRPVAPTRAIE